MIEQITLTNIWNLSILEVTTHMSGPLIFVSIIGYFISIILLCKGVYFIITKLYIIIRSCFNKYIDSRIELQHKECKKLYTKKGK